MKEKLIQEGAAFVAAPVRSPDISIGMKMPSRGTRCLIDRLKRKDIRRRRSRECLDRSPAPATKAHDKVRLREIAAAAYAEWCARKTSLRFANIR